MSAKLVRALGLSFLVAAPAVAQTEQRSVKGSTVAIYNLAGKMRAVAGTGDAVSVEITRGGADAAKLRIETGAIRGRETLRIVYASDRIVYPDMRSLRSRMSIDVREDGTFSEGSWDEFRGRDHVEIRGSGSGLEAFADLVVRIPKGQKVELFLAVGRMDVLNVEGDLFIDVGAADVDVAGTKGALTAGITSSAGSETEKPAFGSKRAPDLFAC